MAGPRLPFNWQSFQRVWINYSKDDESLWSACILPTVNSAQLGRLGRHRVVSSSRSKVSTGFAVRFLFLSLAQFFAGWFLLHICGSFYCSLDEDYESTSKLDGGVINFFEKSSYVHHITSLFKQDPTPLIFYISSQFHVVIIAKIHYVQDTFCFTNKICRP